MNWNPKWLLERGLMPLTPAIITGAVILGCAHAPELQQLPALLSLDAESSVEEETPQPAPTARHVVVAPSPSAEVETLVQGTGNYPDGVYTGSAQGYGGTITVQVTVVGGQITAIEILSAPGETASFFPRAKGVIDRILAAQTWEVDAISGATYSSDGIKAAVENALTGETVITKTPTETTSGNPSALVNVDYVTPDGGYIDGTYTGSAQGFGGTITVSVTIAEGKITDISITSAPGETPSYLASARSVISAMLSAQSPNVDAVSGATYSSTGIINAVKSALSQAAKGTEPSEEPSPSPSPTPTVPDDAPNYGYLDGTYTGTGEGYGGDITVSVTVTDGQITAIEIVSAPDETPAYFNQATGVIEKILAQQVPGVDAVAGATFSSEGIMQAVENALSGAIAPSPSPSPDPSPEPSPSESPEPSPSESPEPTPNVTVETTTETYTGTATVVPDEDEDFDPYEMTLTVTVTVTKTTTVGETETTIVTERKITDAEVTANTDKANLRYLTKAFTKMKDNLIALGNADAVSGATCSSLAIQTAWSKALSGVELTSVTETISNSQGGAR